MNFFPSFFLFNNVLSFCLHATAPDKAIVKESDSSINSSSGSGNDSDDSSDIRRKGFLVVIIEIVIRWSKADVS